MLDVGAEVQPWLAHLAPFAWRFSGQEGEVATRLNAAVLGGCPRFELSSETMKALAYEQRVAQGIIPTRNLAHDWFNGLVWLKYPAVKQQMNRLHVAQGAFGLQGAGNGRSRVRDALTLLDECGAVLFTQDAGMVQALLNHDWQTFFVRHRSAWLAGTTRLCIIGHGLLDSMQFPHKGLCAKVLPVLVERVDEAMSVLDDVLCGVLAHLTVPANFSPLPVMGVPGWFEVSDSPGFYQDTSVFRGKPTRQVDSVSRRLAFRWLASTLSPWKCAGQSLPASFLLGEESPDSCEQSAG
jgi:hypothetical protein